MALPTRARPPAPARKLALAVLCLIQLLVVTDTTIVNVALPTIGAHLALTSSGLTWIVDAYLVTAGGLVLLGGRLADALGPRRVFVTGTALFAAGSLTCAMATTFGVLATGRVVQGIGEALATPAALALLLHLFPAGRERTTALGVWGALAGLGATLGVTASGILVSTFGWRAIFLVNLPPALLAFAVSVRVLPAGPSQRRTINPVAVILLTTAVTSLAAAIIAIRPHTSPPVVAIAAVAVAGLGGLGFVRRERTAASPLIPRSFFGHPTRLGANLISIPVVGSMAGMFYLLSIGQGVG
jgi:MFS family permease